MSTFASRLISFPTFIPLSYNLLISYLVPTFQTLNTSVIPTIGRCCVDVADGVMYKFDYVVAINQIFNQEFDSHK